jgi:3-keto-L-gulonate-6-phosphate decarboxylase
MDSCMAHLHHANDEDTLNLIKNTRKEIAQIITGGITAETMQTLVKSSYNKLFQCFKEIPLYL